jgi:hypothetical protein
MSAPEVGTAGGKDANIIQGAGCTPAITNIAELVNGMREGSVYVNVHTVANPSGEIRGQLTED